MPYIIGPLLVFAGVGMIFFAIPKKRKKNWVARFGFIGELYAVTAVSFVVLGVCIVFLK